MDTTKEIATIEKQPYNPINNIPPEKRWQPGQSGNPAGRPPKAISLTSKVKELLTDDRLDKIAKAMLNELELPNRKEYPSAVLKEVWERLDGKVGPDISALIDNRVFNIIVPSERARELTENINKRLTDGQNSEGANEALQGEKA